MDSRLFSDRLHTAMNKRNVSITRLSSMTGINKGTISSYLSCRYKPKHDKIVIISNALNINPDWLSCVSEYMEIENTLDYESIMDNMNECSMYDASVSAGYTLPVDEITDKETLYIPDFMLGRYSGRDDIIVLRVNGDSMDKILPDGSFMAISTDISIRNLFNGDIVVFRNEYDYSVKEFQNDKKNKRYVFKPVSNNESYQDIIFEYEKCSGLHIIGKVVMYWNTL